MRGALRAALFSLACFLGAAAGPALAAGPSVSYSTWIFSGQSVVLRYRLAVAAAQRLTGVDVPVLTVRELGDYVLAHTAVTAAGRPCPAADQGYDLGKVDPLEVGTGLYGFEIVFRCPEPLAGAVELDERAVFDRVPTHVDFARVEIGGRFIDELFTAGHERLRIAQPSRLEPVGVARYARLGAAHVLDSPDRLCFLLGALLLVRRRRDLAGLGIALASGYGLALLVQRAGLLAPQMPLLEAFVAALIVLIAALVALCAPGGSRRIVLGWPVLLAMLAAVALALHAPRTALLLAGTALFSAALIGLCAARPAHGSAWLLLAAVLGFVDGFVLPALIAPVGLAPRAQVFFAAGYDVGALGTQAALVALAAGGFAALRRGALVPRGPVWVGLAAACLGGVGAFWFVSRLHL